MVAAANSDNGSAVSRQTHSVEGSGGARRSGGDGALGVFARLLAGLTRKMGAGGDGKTLAAVNTEGEIGTEGLTGTEKPRRGLRNASGTGAASPDAEIPVPGSEKIHTRDRRFLAAMRGAGEDPDPEAALQEGSVKKSKPAQQDPAMDESVLSALAGESSAAALQEGPLKGEMPGSPDQDGLLRLAGAEDQVPEDIRTFRGRNGEGADPDASLEAEAGTSVTASPRERGRVREEPGLAKKEKTAETRNSRKNRERFALEIQDVRTGGNGAALNAGQEPAVEAGAEPVADITVELKNDGGSPEPSEPGQAKTAGQAFEDILARELHQNLNGDIVRQASILVKDGGEGTIRLSLKPESLGMVKVRLEMAENKITGRIIVESNEALRAFEREIHSLEQAFRDSGFAGASLEMALAGDGGHNSRERGDTASPFSSRAVSSTYDAMAETMDMFAMDAGFDGFAGPGATRVNVLA